MPPTRFKQAILDLELSIERATERTPEPSKYYVFHKGTMAGFFHTLKAAQARYKQIVDESGFKPKIEIKPKSASQLDIERYLDAKDNYWASSYKHRGSGGKGGRGGV